MEWISVEDRLPKFGTLALVCFTTQVETLQYTTARYINEKVCLHSEKRCPVWYVEVSRGHVLRTITHWMPLPKPPLKQ